MEFARVTITNIYIFDTVKGYVWDRFGCYRDVAFSYQKNKTQGLF